MANLLAHQIASCNPDAVNGDPSYVPTLQPLHLGPQDICSIVAETERALERAEGLMLTSGRPRNAKLAKSIAAQPVSERSPIPSAMASWLTSHSKSCFRSVHR